MASAIRIIDSILIVVAVILFAIGTLLPVYSAGVQNPTYTFFYIVLLAVCGTDSFWYYASIGIGCILFFSSHRIAKNIGLALLAVVSLVNLIIFSQIVYTTTSMAHPSVTQTENIGLGCIMGLIGAIMVIVTILLECISNLVVEDNGNKITDKTINEIMNWKELLDKGIITPEQFAAKRQEILKITADKTEKK